MSDQSAKEIAFELTNRLDEARILFHRLSQKLPVVKGKAPETLPDTSTVTLPPEIRDIPDPDERQRAIEGFLHELASQYRRKRPPLYESDIEKVHAAFRHLGGHILEVTDRIDDD